MQRKGKLSRSKLLHSLVGYCKMQAQALDFCFLWPFFLVSADVGHFRFPSSSLLLLEGVRKVNMVGFARRSA